MMPMPPPYEPPPPWLPARQRIMDPDYNDVRDYLPRKLFLNRNKASEALGFNIRGGQEHHCGIFVSKVMPNSEADRLGIQEGDQILSVNDVDFEGIDHAEAVKVLKMNISIEMVLKFFPYGYNKTYDKNRLHASNILADHR